MRLTVSLHQEKTELPIKLQSDNTELDAGFTQYQTVGTTNYEKLRNLPTLDGRPIIGNVVEKDPTVSQWAKHPVKPSYTAEEVGALSGADLQTLTAADLEIMWESFK